METVILNQLDSLWVGIALLHLQFCILQWVLGSHFIHLIRVVNQTKPKVESQGTPT